MTAYAAIPEIVWIRGVMTELGLEAKGFQVIKDTSPTILVWTTRVLWTWHRTLSTTRGQSISELSIIGFISKWKATLLLPTPEMTADMMTKSLHHQHVNTVIVYWVGMLSSSML